MRESPRIRRLRADHESLKKLDLESTILSFHSIRNPPEVYHVTFRGVGIWRMKTGELALRDVHEVTIELAAAYPRLIPNLSWKTPIFHPNISSSGVVCLGGYGTNWVPSLTLDEMCTMLWDMIRYRNYDTESPYNKDAAIWARSQTKYLFPLDNRSLRNQVSGQNAAPFSEPIRNIVPPPVVGPSHSLSRKPVEPATEEEVQIVDAVVVEPNDEDVLFIE